MGSNISSNKVDTFVFLEINILATFE